MHISTETLVKQLICAVLALTITVLSTQSVVHSSGLSNVTERTMVVVQHSAPGSLQQAG